MYVYKVMFLGSAGRLEAEDARFHLCRSLVNFVPGAVPGATVLPFLSTQLVGCVGALGAACRLVVELCGRQLQHPIYAYLSCLVFLQVYLPLRAPWGEGTSQGPQDPQLQTPALPA